MILLYLILATYLSNLLNLNSYDLTYKFTHVHEDVVLAVAQDRWSSPTVNAIKHTIGHDTCHARLLAKCLLASITPYLSIAILNHIPSMCNDSSYLLWILSKNIYQNNVAFTEHIRENVIKKICKIPDLHKTQQKNDSFHIRHEQATQSLNHIHLVPTKNSNQPYFLFTAYRISR